MSDLKQFLELFNPSPGSHYLQVAVSKDEITSALLSLMESVDGELKIVLYNEDNLDFSKPFRAKPSDNDIVLFKDIFYTHENQKMLLKLAYITLSNTAHIIIIEKKGVMNIEALKIMLEEFEFRAANDIDVLDGYDLVIAKKMHMWGNEL